MSVYISGMEMPTTGHITVIEINCLGGVRINGKPIENKAIPVSNHGDLIDRDKLEKDIDKYIGGEESRSRFHHWVQVQNVVIPGKKGAET